MPSKFTGSKPLLHENREKIASDLVASLRNKSVAEIEQWIRNLGPEDRYAVLATLISFVVSLKQDGE